MATATLTLRYRGPFSLAASVEFLEGFAPAGAAPQSDEQGLRLAFPVEGEWETAGVLVSHVGQEVRAHVTGEADPVAVEAQLARLLSIDVDGSGFTTVGQRDGVIGDLQRRHPGLRPLGFWSAYESACWAVLSHRVRMTQAASVKQRLAERHGQRLEVHGRELCAFPAPGVLRDLERVDGVPERKLEWLRGIADAALDGSLEGARLREVDRGPALAALQALPGIGPFSAELILLRGAAHPDVFPRHERRLHRVMAAAYGLTDPSIEELAAIAENWRPYRTWAAFLLRARAAEEA